MWPSLETTEVAPKLSPSDWEEEEPYFQWSDSECSQRGSRRPDVPSCHPEQAKNRPHKFKGQRGTKKALGVPCGWVLRACLSPQRALSGQSLPSLQKELSRILGNHPQRSSLGEDVGETLPHPGGHRAWIPIRPWMSEDAGPGHWHLPVWDEPGPARGTGGKALSLAGCVRVSLLQGGLEGSRRSKADVWTASQEFIQSLPLTP